MAFKDEERIRVLHSVIFIAFYKNIYLKNNTNELGLQINMHAIRFLLKQNNVYFFKRR